MTAALDVASRARHPATSAPTGTGSPSVSRPVAATLQQEEPQKSVAIDDMSQMSQVAASTWDEVDRAAIVEYEGLIPSAWAEGLARLHPDRPPADVPLCRWYTFVEDCGRFLLGGWAKKAAVLGWGPFDLFGCDPERPFARIDRAGLLWLLDGNRLIELDHHTAIIKTQTGAQQSYRRRPIAVGDVALAWELIDADKSTKGLGSR